MVLLRLVFSPSLGATHCRTWADVAEGVVTIGQLEHWLRREFGLRSRTPLLLSCAERFALPRSLPLSLLEPRQLVLVEEEVVDVSHREHVAVALTTNILPIDLQQQGKVDALAVDEGHQVHEERTRRKRERKLEKAARKMSKKRQRSEKSVDPSAACPMLTSGDSAAGREAGPRKARDKAEKRSRRERAEQVALLVESQGLHTSLPAPGARAAQCDSSQSIQHASISDARRYAHHGALGACQPPPPPPMVEDQNLGNGGERCMAIDTATAAPNEQRCAGDIHTRDGEQGWDWSNAIAHDEETWRAEWLRKREEREAEEEKLWPCPLFAPRHRLTEDEEVADDSSNTLDFEALPTLLGDARPGDRIAFQATELSPAWEPCLVWRVASVISANQGKLALCLHCRKQDDAAAHLGEAENDTLVEQQANLTGLRLVWRNDVEESSAVGGMDKAEQGDRSAPANIRAMPTSASDDRTCASPMAADNNRAALRESRKKENKRQRRRTREGRELEPGEDCPAASLSCTTPSPSPSAGMPSGTTRSGTTGRRAPQVPGYSRRNAAVRQIEFYFSPVRPLSRVPTLERRLGVMLVLPQGWREFSCVTASATPRREA